MLLALFDALPEGIRVLLEVRTDVTDLLSDLQCSIALSVLEEVSHFSRDPDRKFLDNRVASPVHEVAPFSER